jgi:glycosyltransferase involved in cell wall biosynthesis
MSRDTPPRVMFTYWGRRGLTQMTHDIAATALADPDGEATVCVSRQNEAFDTFAALGPSIFPVDTFAANSGALTSAWRIPLLRRSLLARLKADRTEAVIELMPHVWSPAIMPAVQASGVRYISIIHDAKPHPGDYRTRVVNRLLDRVRHQADRLITLSEVVAAQVAADDPVLASKLTPLFHPDLVFRSKARAPAMPLAPPQAGHPLRLLWLGRIMPYKGLPLFLDAVEHLRGAGVAVKIGVFGEGALGECRARLDALGSEAEVVNRWLTDAEIADILPRFHSVVLSHVEASQSGVASTALGAGLPIVATPVGGLVEQIRDGETGILAERVDAPALAAAIMRLLHDPELFRRMTETIAARRHDRSTKRFVDACIAEAVRARQRL